MTRYKNILVAFDGSEDGLKALEAAKTMTEDNAAHLTVAYVHEKPLEHPVTIGTTPKGEQFMYANYTAPGALSGSAPEIPDDREQIIVEEELPKQVMANAQSKLDENLDVTYENLVGKPAAKIVDYASDEAIDLIIVGNRGVNTLKKMVMGSVSQKITNDAECSVFVVK